MNIERPRHLFNVKITKTITLKIPEENNNNNNNNNNGFICIAVRLLDYTISSTQDSAYNITQIII